MRKMIASALAALFLHATPALAQSPALWSVSDADTTIYLFGSVHATRGDVTWFSGAIRAAYNASDEIAIENDSNPASNDPTAERYAEAKLPLRQYLSGPQAARLEAVLANLGRKPSWLDKYQPWYANLVLSTSAMSGSGFDASAGVETILRQSAAHDGKKVVGMETREHQYFVLSSVPIAAQVRQLDMTLTDPSAERAGVEVRVNCWRIGDLACIGIASDRYFQAIPEVREALLVKRSAVFARWIADRMKQPGTVFVAVGLEHFVGPGSLIDQLGEMGRVVRRVG